MNIPNSLTVLRFLLVPVFLWLLFHGATRYALAVFVFAGLTDAVDGAVARLTNRMTELGVLLDPIADKALVLSAFVSLTVLGSIPKWLTGTLAVKEAVVVAGSVLLYRQGYRFQITPTMTGKATTFFLIALLVVAMLGMDRGRGFAFEAWLEWLVAALILVSGAQYMARGYKLIAGKGAP